MPEINEAPLHIVVDEGTQEDESEEENRGGASGGGGLRSVELSLRISPPPPRLSQDAVVEEKQSSERTGTGGEASSSQAETTALVEPSRSEIDGCLICMDSFHSAGDHQICCLPCGHLYGLSCITKWLKNHKRKCPQCKTKCTLKDVRKIFGQAVVVDQELVQKAESLEAKCIHLEKKDSDWKCKEIEWKKREADLKMQLHHLKERTRCLEHMSRDTNIVQSNAGHYLDRQSSVHTPSSCYFLQKELQITGGRYLDLDASSEMIVIARRLSGLSGRHVLTKVSMVDPLAKEDIELLANTKAIRDLHISPHGRLVLLASLGKKLSVISTDSNNMVLNYDLPAAAWSCSWDVSSSHYIYAGLQNGALLMFDVRQTSSSVESLNGLTCNPIHTLRSLLPDRSVASGVRSLLTASSTGICEWTFDSNEKRSPFLVPESQNQGVCIAVTCFPSSNDVVASFRPKIEAPSEIAVSQPLLTPSSTVMGQTQGSHVLYRKVGSRSYEKLGSRWANVNSVRLPRSAIIQGQNNQMLFASEDEASHGLALQELPSFEVVQCLPSQHQSVHDLKYTPYQNYGLLGCLTDDKLQLYSTRQL